MSFHWSEKTLTQRFYHYFHRFKGRLANYLACTVREAFFIFLRNSLVKKGLYRTLKGKYPYQAFFIFLRNSLVKKGLYRTLKGKYPYQFKLANFKCRNFKCLNAYCSVQEREKTKIFRM